MVKVWREKEDFHAIPGFFAHSSLDSGTCRQFRGTCPSGHPTHSWTQCSLSFGLASRTSGVSCPRRGRGSGRMKKEATEPEAPSTVKTTINLSNVAMKDVKELATE